MKRIDCLQYLSQGITNEIVLTGLTGVAWIWNHVSDHEGSMKVGSMGNASAVALGAALALPNRRIIALDSDGSVLLDLATLTTIGRYCPPNLAVIAFDNELYSGTNIDQPSSTGTGADLELMAKAAGIAEAITVTSVREFERVADQIFEGVGLHYVVAKVEPDPEVRDLPKPTIDYAEYKYRIWRYLEKTEGRAIAGNVW